MSAAELRQAAETLRKNAEGATPGPWRQEYSKKSGDCVIDAESQNCLDSVARTTHLRSGLDARHIATLHPGVGLALADLLDAQAEHVASHDCEAHCAYPDGSPQCRAALSVARLVNEVAQ